MTETVNNCAPWTGPDIEIVGVTYKNLPDGTVLVTWTYQRKA